MSLRPLLACLAALMIGSGCASTQAPAPAVARDRATVPDARAGASLPVDRADAPVPPRIESALSDGRPVDFLLLGELHDHPLHHAVRAHWLEALASRGRFAIALEQLDADRQPALDAALRQYRAGQGTGASASASAQVGEAAMAEAARRIAEAAGFDFRGWQWSFYEPFVSLALRRDLPLVAANLPNVQARQIARGGAHPLAGERPAGWGEAEDAAMAAEIRDGHCGMLPERLLAPMAAAQRARDAQIARALVQARQATGLPVVLIAGNGHVRTDLGVPRHLRALVPQARVLAVGLVESGPAVAPYDLRVPTPAHPRPDPCEAFRAPRN